MATKDKAAKKRRKAERQRRQTYKSVKPIQPYSPPEPIPDPRPAKVPTLPPTPQASPEPDPAPRPPGPPLERHRAIYHPALERTILVAALRRTAVLRGEFTLASGQKSDHYIDCRRAFLQDPAATIAGHVCAALMSKLSLYCLAGPTSGADPIVSSTVVAGRGLYRGGFVRPAAKQHGTERLVEGALHPGDEVLLVEDVVTTGGSMVRAADSLRLSGILVRHALAFVDRGVDLQRLDDAGLCFYYAVSVDELLE